MIHYHGVPISGSRVDNARFLTGRHAFISYARPDEIETAASFCQSFALDNGAYSAWSRGEAVDVDGFISWASDWLQHPACDFAIIPDVITGSEAENDHMLSCWPQDLRGVPVWHMAESIERLDRLCSHWPRVAMATADYGSRERTDGWWRRMREAMDAICDAEGRPPTRLHGLKMMDPRIFRHLPLSSADSTNAARNANMDAGWGYLRPPTAAQRAAVIADRIEAHSAAGRWSQPGTTIELGPLFGENRA